MRRKVRIALGACALLILVFFIAFNWKTVSVHLLFFGVLETKQAWVIFGSAILGASAQYLLQAYRQRRPGK
ncbi:MAG: hypothetical protein HY716_18055 [Planctomycetes bacterium]|nr:hypothetical protein [Planctomycetota bacterium]